VVSKFHAFCDSKNIPTFLCLPARKIFLYAFAARHIGELASNTIQNHMAALKAWHMYNDSTWKGSPCLFYVLNGLKNLTPASSKRPPQPPITCSMLLLLAPFLNLSDPFDACCFVAASVLPQPREGLSHTLLTLPPCFPTLLKAQCKQPESAATVPEA
ncbi:hypothetical protein BS17DRAFT_864153, partial [Gyrodon lividus]